MPMSTEQALAYMSKDTAKEPETKETVPSTEPEVPESKSEVKDAASPEETADKTNTNDGVEPKPEEVSKADNPAEPKDDKVDTKKDNDKSKRDYAFIREKNKRKEQKAKYEARIKELEAKLKERDGLEEKHFTKPDGSPDSNAYVRNEFAKRDMQDEIKQLKQQDTYEQEQFDIEQDRIITEHCFQGKALEDYRTLIKDKGSDFMAALQENDPNNVVLNYLDTLQEYPVVLKELMTNMDALRRVFRSKDPDSLKHSVRIVSDEILDKYHARQTAPAAPATPAQPVQPTVPEKKPSIPVIGKQISSQSGGAVTTHSLLRDRNTMNNYLATHKRH